jgi:23S rRNA (pseudouridine1915-N3)-methyltransferase
MKVLIISPGKGHDDTVASGIAKYEKRLSRSVDLAWLFPPSGDVEKEGASIVKALKDGDFVVLLDERGKDIDSLGLSSLIDKHKLSGAKRLVFIIGGAYGVSGEVKARAQATLKLSSLVFPHMLVRLILLEQLYRALSILGGSKYHHA